MDSKVSTKDVLKDRNFLTLWWSMLLSTSATFLLLLAVSSLVFEQTGSSFKSSAIFSVHWLLPVILFPLIGYICSTYSARKILVTSEMASALLSVGAGLVFESFYPALYGIFLLRGFFESLTKSTRTVALKSSIAPEKLEVAASLFNTSYYLGIGVGSICGAFVITILPISVVAIASGAMFVLAALLYGSLETDEVSKTAVSKNFLTQWKDTFVATKQYGLTKYLVGLAVVVAAFQGFHNVARNIFPMDILGFGTPGTSYLQIVNTLGILLGAVFVSRFLLRQSKLPQSPEFLIFATSFTLTPLIYVTNPALGLLSYFVFAFFFEVAFTKLQNEIVLRCPKEKLGMLSAFNHSVLVGSMMVAVFGMGAAVDYFGFAFFTAGLAISLIVVYGALLLSKSLGEFFGTEMASEAHSIRGE